MKKLLIISTFILSLILFVNFGVKKINNEKNEKYIETIFLDDEGLKRQYGTIKKYKIIKIGRSFGSNNELGYDYYRLYLYGGKSEGLIRLNIYKDKDGNIVKYHINE